MTGDSTGWLSLLPPLLAIGLAIATRQVVLSLSAGIWIGGVILAGGNLLLGTAHAIEGVIGVFAQGWQTKVILFTLLMGSLLLLMQRSGGIEGFVRWAERWAWARSRRGAMLLAWVLGMGIFLESTITCLVAGTVSRPLFDRLKISREKLAYLCDSTSAPVCMLIPLNGWGALILGLLAAQTVHLSGQGPMTVFLAAVGLNFYAILTVLLAFIVAATGWDFGPMRCAEKRAREEGKLLRDGATPVVDTAIFGAEPNCGAEPKMRNLFGPLAVLLLMVPAGIAITGAQGVRAAGIAAPTWTDYLNQASGSTAVLWGVLLAVVVAAAMLAVQRLFRIGELVDIAFKGAGGLIPLAAIMLLAFAIGATCNQLGTGPWLASAAKPFLTPALIAPAVFVISGLIAFSTGTSWGTFAIMMPLALPLTAAFQADGAGISTALVVSAVLGGGVFGDHCSPVSDTTVVSSMAAWCDHIDHVRTQLPYALLAGGLSLLLYLTVGWIQAG